MDKQDYILWPSDFGNDNTSRGDLIVLGAALLILFWFGFSFLERYKDYLFTVPPGLIGSSTGDTQRPA